MWLARFGVNSSVWSSHDPIGPTTVVATIAGPLLDRVLAGGPHGA